MIAWSASWAFASDSLPSSLWTRSFKFFTWVATAAKAISSERLAAVFPSLQPAGSLVVIYDGQSDQISGLILQIGSRNE